MPVEKIENTLCKNGAIGYKAVKDGEIVGGTIISIDEWHQHGSLELLYVKRSMQSKEVGKFGLK